VGHEGDTYGALIGELRAEADRPVVRERIAVVRLHIHGIEGIDAVLIADVDTETRPWSHLDSDQSDPTVAPRCACLLGHADEGVRVPRLDLPEVTREVVDNAHLASDGHPLKGIRRHPDVRRVDVALVDELPVALHEGVILIAERPPGFAQRVVALLP
jgi:hypothetical protein